MQKTQRKKTNVAKNAMKWIRENHEYCRTLFLLIIAVAVSFTDSYIVAPIIAWIAADIFDLQMRIRRNDKEIAMIVYHLMTVEKRLVDKDVKN